MGSFINRCAQTGIALQDGKNIKACFYLVKLQQQTNPNVYNPVETIPFAHFNATARDYGQFELNSNTDLKSLVDFIVNLKPFTFKSKSKNKTLNWETTSYFEGKNEPINDIISSFKALPAPSIQAYKNFLNTIIYFHNLNILIFKNPENPTQAYSLHFSLPTFETFHIFYDAKVTHKDFQDVHSYVKFSNETKQVPTLFSKYIPSSNFFELEFAKKLGLKLIGVDFAGQDYNDFTFLHKKMTLVNAF